MKEVSYSQPVRNLGTHLELSHGTRIGRKSKILVLAPLLKKWKTQDLKKLKNQGHFANE